VKGTAKRNFYYSTTGIISGRGLRSVLGPGSMAEVPQRYTDPPLSRCFETWSQPSQENSLPPTITISKTKVEKAMTQIFGTGAVPDDSMVRADNLGSGRQYEELHRHTTPQTCADESGVRYEPLARRFSYAQKNRFPGRIRRAVIGRKNRRAFSQKAHKSHILLYSAQNNAARNQF